MSNTYVFLSIAAMALTTYFIRMLPMAIFRRKIENRWIKSFLYYVPYVVLSAMTFPAIFYSTDNTLTAAIGTVVAVILAYFKLPITVVAFSACAAALISGFII